MLVAPAAVVVGGFRSIPLAFAAGLALGVAQNLVAGYATFTQSILGFNTSVPFVVLLVAVVLLGRSRERRAGSLAQDAVPADALDDGPPARRRPARWLVPARACLGDDVLCQWNWLRGGDLGWPIKRPSLGPLHFSDNRTLAVTLLLVVLLVAWIIRNLTRSASGRQMAAVRASEPAAASSGISPTMVKLRLFTISAALAGAGGVLLATYNQQATNVNYVTEVGLVWLATAVLWGVRRPLAPGLAALTGAVGPALLSNGFHWPSWVPTFLSWNGTHSVWIPNVLFALGALTMAQDPEGILSAIRN